MAALMLAFCLPVFAVAENGNVPGPAENEGEVINNLDTTDEDATEPESTAADDETTTAAPKDEPVNQPATDTSAYVIKDEKHTVYKIPDQTFTGSEIKPELIISYHFGRKTEIELQVQTDYVVEYSSNTEVGTATAHIVYKGDFAELGEETITFRIAARDVSSVASIDDLATQRYTGSAIEPALDITVGNNELLEGIDYLVEYSDNVEPGTATARVTYIGNYKGNAKKDFLIRKDASKAVVAAIPDQSYTGSEITPALDIKFDGKTLIEGEDYEVSYLKNINAGTATVKISYIGSYAGSATKTFKIIGKDGTSASSITNLSDVVYTGEAIEPSLKITNNGTQLEEGKDYTLDYKDNINVGKASVIVKYTGGYTGEEIVNFNIKPMNASKATIAVINEQPYAFGRPVMPDALVSLTENGKTINFEEGVDYDFEYTNNRKVGKAGIKAVFKGNYTGSVSSSFNIGAADVSDATIAPIPDQKHTGSAVTPRIKVLVGKNKLKKDRDYTVAYSNNTALGTATVTVTFRGNYKGTATATFNITETGASSIAQTGEIGAAVVGGIAVIAGVTFFIVKKKKKDADED